MKYDIFISYRTTDGTTIGRSLKEFFDSNNYSAYFNPDEQKHSDFTEELRSAIVNCKDFLILFTEGYRQRLLNEKERVYILNEIITAKDSKKNIIGLIAEGVLPPSESENWPEEIKELICRLPYILIPRDFYNYIHPPIDKMFEKLMSKPEKDEIYRDIAFSNKKFDMNDYFSRLTKKAEDGEYEAMFELANLYYYGIQSGVKGPETAYKYLRLIIDRFSNADKKEQCYYNACNLLARMYYDGQVPDDRQSYAKSYHYHKLASDGNFYSQCGVAFMSRLGIGCSYDYETALKESQKSASGTDDIAKMDLAAFYEKNGKYREALEIYENMSGHNPKADLAIGNLYLNGVLEDPPRPNPQQAFFYFTCAVNGDPPSSEAAFQLGRMFFLGLYGMRCDFKQAEKYFKTADKAGHPEAPYMLGFMYEFGHVKKDHRSAIKCFEKAVSMGDINSLHHLAVLYQFPENRNYHKAFQYAKRSAEYGKSEGEYIYAVMLFLGRGCEPDIKEAKIYFQKALSDGMTQAKYMLDIISTAGSCKE